jgi:hypothetical protein
MANKKKQSVKAKSVSGRAKASQPGASRTKKANAAVGMAAANDHFVKGLLVRGEAVTADSTGKVPRDATHIIESQNQDGTAVVKRVRYKLF